MPLLQQVGNKRGTVAVYINKGGVTAQRTARRQTSRSFGKSKGYQEVFEVCRSGRTIAATAVAAIALAGGAFASPPASQETTVPVGVSQQTSSASAEETRSHGPRQDRVAARENVQRYSQIHRLIGSYVLNLAGERIGWVDNLVVDDAGKVTQVLIDLRESLDIDGTPVPVASSRAEIVSVEGAQITVIRVDMSREELVQAQLSRLNKNARAPAEREAGRPDTQHLVEPLF